LEEEVVGVPSWDWKTFARACERVGWLLFEEVNEVDEVDEFGVVLLTLLVSRDRFVESRGTWLLFDEKLEVVLGLVLVSGSVLISVAVAAFCLRAGVELSLLTRARRGEGGDGICARPGILGLKDALVGGLVEYIVLLFDFVGLLCFGLVMDIDACAENNKPIWMIG
jgi:hypothetical protein